MKNQNENENENETNRKSWTDEKIINCIVNLNFIIENITKEFEEILINIGVIEAIACTSPHLMKRQVINKNKKLVPHDKMIDLVLQSITLKEKAGILKVRIAHAEESIKFFRGIIDG